MVPALFRGRLHLKKDRDAVDWVDLAAKVLQAGGTFVVTVLGFVVAVLGYSLERQFKLVSEVQRQDVAAQEIERRFTPSPCLKASDDPATAALLPLVLAEASSDRRPALIALAALDPARVIAISPALYAGATNDRARSLIRTAILDASDRYILVCFYSQLQFAREFLSKGLLQRACDEFPRAWNVLPKETKVNHTAFERGLAACSRGELVIGTDALRDAFRNVPPSRYPY